MKTLIVDDDPISLDLLENALNELGHEVIKAESATAALEVLGGSDIRFVISDWEMPGMSGLELCQLIREKEFGGYVYIVLLTSHRGREAMIQGMNAGADDFLEKPFDPAELAVRVRAGERIVGLETRDLAIFALARLAESRDPETGAHLDRVRSYCQILAERLRQRDDFPDQIDTNFIRLIYLTSPLHDIGKVAVPDFVLLKPGQLSDAEFAIMKTHTTVGAETLNDALRAYPNVAFLEMARDIALTHHERYDGTGYPNGLAGDAIPLVGRIVAVADVYDALTSKRVYKDAYTHDVARSLLIEGSGKHFDARIVNAFLDEEETFKEIRFQLHRDDVPA